MARARLRHPKARKLVSHELVRCLRQVHPHRLDDHSPWGNRHPTGHAGSVAHGSGHLAAHPEARIATAHQQYLHQRGARGRVDYRRQLHAIGVLQRERQRHCHSARRGRHCGVAGFPGHHFEPDRRPDRQRVAHRGAGRQHQAGRKRRQWRGARRHLAPYHHRQPQRHAYHHSQFHYEHHGAAKAHAHRVCVHSYRGHRQRAAADIGGASYGGRRTKGTGTRR